LSLPAYVRVAYPAASAAGTPPPEVSVIIPAYNEESRIGPYLETILKYFAEHGESHEVLVANDGSRDGTAQLVRDRMHSTVSLGLVDYDQNRGKGHAVRMGMLAARGKLRLFADADGSTPIAELERLRSRMRQDGSSVAVGSRQLSAPGVERRIKPHRYLIGQCFRLARQVFLNVRVLDSQCGFKLFTSEAAKRIFAVSRIDGFAFDVEALYLAGRAGLPVSEVAVNWYDSTSTRVNLLTDPFKMLRDMLRIRGLHRSTKI